jgi:long-subunit acyl-CoA synthetase (AMP-forming)
MADTVIGVLEDTARRHAERPALQAKRDGRWLATSWRDYRDQVMRTARGLMALGLGAGGGVAILGFNRPEWFLADLGAIAAGGIPAGIYTTSSPEQCLHIAEHAEAAVVVVENTSHLRTFLPLRARLPRLRAIVLMDGESSEAGVLSWAQLLARGDDVPETALRERIAAQRPDDPATLIYTSGTTGPPKAVMISHRNITWMSRQVVTHYAFGERDRLLSYLPLSHVAEQVLSIHATMASGGAAAFAESLEAVTANLREVRPDSFFAVPRAWEKLQAGVEAAAFGQGRAERAIFGWARRVGRAAGRAAEDGRRQPLLHGLAKAVVFDRVRARLGLDRARVCAVSAAPVARETLDFFESLGITILEIYGQSECTGPATFSLPDRYRLGRAGRAVPGTEIRIAADGEILIRGPHVFLGYYKDEAATREVVDEDGFLHTGDVGDLDGDGFLRVSDRKKELIITSGGKNIGPQVLEGRFKQIPAVSQAVVVGERRNYVTALFTLDPQRTPAVAASVGSPARDVPAAAECAVFRAWLEREVERVNATLARYESVRRFAVLRGEFTVEGGELTPTLKVKRRVVYQKYAAEIERLYAAADERGT